MFAGPPETRVLGAGGGPGSHARPPETARGSSTAAYEDKVTDHLPGVARGVLHPGDF